MGNHPTKGHKGANVVLGARRREHLEVVASEIERAGGKAGVLAGDVGDESYAEALVHLAAKRFGGLDVAFNNAGSLGAMGDTTAVSAADWTGVALLVDGGVSIARQAAF